MIRSGAVALAVVLALGLASCGNEEAELAEKAKQEQAELDKGVAAMNAGDFNAAITVFRPLAEAGNTAAQNNLGWLYFNGKGVPENDAEATKLFQQAAEKGPGRGPVQSRLRL